MPFIRMAALCLAILFVVDCGSNTSPTAPSAPGKAYLAEVLDIMQANALNRRTIDWTSFRQTVTAVAPNPQTIDDTYPAIATALGLLNDLHASLQKPDGTYILNPSRAGRCNCRGCYDEIPAPSVPPDIGYVRVGTCLLDGSAATEFAVNVQRAVAAADTDAVRGWIVDLRGNNGGNMYPMIAGVGPVLGEGTAGAFIDADGALVANWGYQNGVATYGNGPAIQVPNPYTLKRPSPKVAVLTDCTVASSGEAVAISFVGRPNTRSFGTATWGASNAPRLFRLSDGAQLILAVNVMADRNMTRYGGPVRPNEVIDDESLTAERAIKWLRAY